MPKRLAGTHSSTANRVGPCLPHFVYHSCPENMASGNPVHEAVRSPDSLQTLQPSVRLQYGGEDRRSLRNKGIVSLLLLDRAALELRGPATPRRRILGKSKIDKREGQKMVSRVESVETLDPEKTTP